MASILATISSSDSSVIGLGGSGVRWGRKSAGVLTASPVRGGAEQRPVITEQLERGRDTV
jgi:hypothetical protein